MSGAPATQRSAAQAQNAVVNSWTLPTSSSCSTAEVTGFRCFTRYHCVLRPSVTLELGGKSPSVLSRSADISSAASRLAIAKSTNAGQLCVSPDLIYVPRENTEAFIDAFTDQFTGQLRDHELALHRRHLLTHRARLGQQCPANQAWSQVPPEAPQQPRREDWAPTQRPQPFQDDPRRQGPPRQDPHRQAKYAPAPPRRTPPNAPPRPPEPPKQRRPRKRRSWGKRIGITLLVLLLALAGF